MENNTPSTGAMTHVQKRRYFSDNCKDCPHTEPKNAKNAKGALLPKGYFQVGRGWMHPGAQSNTEELPVL